MSSADGLAHRAGLTLDGHVTFRADFEHRDALIGAALDEFSEHGYHAASLNRILAAAGMSKG